MNQEDVHIDPAKIREYLLSSSHPVGRFKALFFFRLGYVAEEWEGLDRDLRSLLETGTRLPPIDGHHGLKHVVRGRIVGPNGMVADLTTVWITRHGENTLRFVTAYPGEIG